MMGWKFPFSNFGNDNALETPSISSREEPGLVEAYAPGRRSGIEARDRLNNASSHD
jgi:hypothetical protein